tara:strand:+ start:1175 stop:2545 length:1371 start_codon:yes stop_codon:yes gene_type:complete
MARRPFFSGNYGSSLAQIDTRPIMQGAAAQAAAYQGIGQNIGGAIEKYGLMKEKQKKQQANIKSTVNFLDSLANQDPDNAEQYEIMKAQLNDPEIPLTTRDELANQGIKQLTLSQQMLQRKGLMDATSANTALTLQTKDLNDALKQSKVDAANSEAELKGFQATMEKFNLEDFMKLRPKQQLLRLQRLKNELSGEEVATIVNLERGGPEGIAREQIEEMKQKKQALAENLKHVSAQIAHINKKTEQLGKIDPKDAVTLQNLLAEAEKFKAEAEKMRAETEAMGELTGGDAESVPEQASIRPPDVAEAAGGDVAGVFQDVINSAFGVVGASGFEERHRETANLRALNAQLQPALTKAISSQGSVYTQEKMDKILPQPTDSNPAMQSKLESLVPILVSKVEEAKIVAPNAKAGEQRSRALRILKTIPGIISALETSISQKNRRPVNEEADRILEEAGY